MAVVVQGCISVQLWFCIVAVEDREEGWWSLGRQPSTVGKPPAVCSS